MIVIYICYILITVVGIPFTFTLVRCLIYFVIYVCCLRWLHFVVVTFILVTFVVCLGSFCLRLLFGCLRLFVVWVVGYDLHGWLCPVGY